MSDHYLIVDDARREYVDCDKFLLDPDAWDFMADCDAFTLAANMGEPAPERSTRYMLCKEDAHKLFDWMKACTKKLRILAASNGGHNDFDLIERTYKRIPLYPEDT